MVDYAKDAEELEQLAKKEGWDKEAEAIIKKRFEKQNNQPVNQPPKQ